MTSVIAAEDDVDVEGAVVRCVRKDDVVVDAGRFVMITRVPEDLKHAKIGVSLALPQIKRVRALTCWESECGWVVEVS